MALEGVTGRLKRVWNFHNTGIGVENEVVYPPGNKTVFIGTDRDDRLTMWDFVRNVTTTPPWKSPEHFLIIPKAPLSSDVNNVVYIEQQRTSSRYQDMHANRTAFVYDSYWHNQPVIHFISKPSYNLRLLENFYTFLYFEDVEQDKRYKRFVRDFVHYVDTIFCKAALIIHSLMVESAGSGYSSFHIRR
jgi:hypothetical protein